MNSGDQDARREHELHREAVRLAIRELHASTGPTERRLRQAAREAILAHTERLQARVQRFMPEVIVQGLPEPYDAPVRSRFR